MVMVYQNLIFPRQCQSLLVLARHCPSFQSMLVRPVNASKARKESLCDSARAMLFNVSKASQC